MYLPGCPPRPEMLMDAILKIHAKIMDEPLGTKRAAELAASGHTTELVPSSIRFAPKGKRHERETQLGAPNELRALAERGGEAGTRRSTGRSLPADPASPLREGEGKR
jgi:hypothetical protein